MWTFRGFSSSGVHYDVRLEDLLLDVERPGSANYSREREVAGLRPAEVLAVSTIIDEQPPLLQSFLRWKEARR